MRNLILVVVFLFGLGAAAQTDRATLTGIVSDQSRGVIPNATITLVATATGLRHAAAANGAGAYTMSSLPVGQYTASIKADGFDTVQVEPFTLNVGETRTLNATLHVSSVSSQVTVVA